MWLIPIWHEPENGDNVLLFFPATGPVSRLSKAMRFDSIRPGREGSRSQTSSRVSTHKICNSDSERLMTPNDGRESFRMPTHKLLLTTHIIHVSSFELTSRQTASLLDSVLISRFCRTFELSFRSQLQRSTCSKEAQPLPR